MDRDDEFTQFFLTWQLFLEYGGPDVPLNTVAVYHCLGGERSMHYELNKRFELAQRMSQEVWLERPGLFENQKLEILF